MFVCFSPPPQEVSEPTKEEKAVAKYLRFNCPTKSTNMMGHRVDYFIGQCSIPTVPLALQNSIRFPQTLRLSVAVARGGQQDKKHVLVSVL